MRAATDADAGDSALKLVPNEASATALAEQMPERQSWAGLFARREMGLVAAMLAVVVPVAFVNPLIFSEINLTSLAMDASLLVIVTLAQLLVLVTRNIDLSVASIIGLAAYGSALVMTSDPSIGIAAGLLTGIGLGLACGPSTA